MFLCFTVLSVLGGSEVASKNVAMPAAATASFIQRQQSQE